MILNLYQGILTIHKISDTGFEKVLTQNIGDLARTLHYKEKHIYVLGIKGSLTQVSLAEILD